MTETLSPKARAWLADFLEKIDAAQDQLLAEQAERAALPPMNRRQPSADRLRRQRGPADAEQQAYEDAEFERCAAMKAAAIAKFRETALKVALAAS